MLLVCRTKFERGQHDKVNFYVAGERKRGRRIKKKKRRDFRLNVVTVTASLTA